MKIIKRQKKTTKEMAKQKRQKKLARKLSYSASHHIHAALRYIMRGYIMAEA